MIVWVGGALGIAALLALVLVAFLYIQGRRPPRGGAAYVALGSSFAAGIGLGPRAEGAPLVCQRSTNGYPAQLARKLGLSFEDMTCSGATTRHVLTGGQVFLGPQIDAIGPGTRLVTITSGGNDVRYVGDLAFTAGTKGSSLLAWGMRRLWSGPLATRDFAGLHDTLLATLREIRRRAPRARIVVVTYPMILPPSGTCATLNLSAAEVTAMRAVGHQLAETTRDAAREAGADLTDMEHIGVDHHACSGEPWVNGWNDAHGTQFHPTIAGATAIADRIAALLKGPSQ
ncbi:SGNH/GDSL hydrolase family protein [uncultured Sphingomonas sp.]|uniref:SGNH/GDSL hydrolase family protein n=1 Tax=uncultured Sphingomonas sp. TaxID=158754 RepID=UPI00263A31CA|nr:SGNH/GDSL hydrolase family protein [uncultured Sphingomonas sp.]